jgi:hypothetical protein
MRDLMLLALAVVLTGVPAAAAGQSSSPAKDLEGRPHRAKTV